MLHGSEQLISSPTVRSKNFKASVWVCVLFTLVNKVELARKSRSTAKKQDRIPALFRIQTMKAFCTWIDELDHLYDHRDPHESVWLRCGTIVAEAGDHAARLGLAEQFDVSRSYGPMVDPSDAKAFLARCIGACPTHADAKPQLLDAAALADLLGITPRSVWRRKNDGTLPKHVQLGRLVRWHSAEGERWLSGK